MSRSRAEGRFVVGALLCLVSCLGCAACASGSRDGGDARASWTAGASGGQDPMGEGLLQIYQEFQEAGRPSYETFAAERRKA